MNNDLELFSEETLIFYRDILAIDFGGNSKIDIPQSSLLALVNIALAAKQAKPVAYAVFADNGNIRIWSTEKHITEDVGVSHPLYTTPQPAHTEQDGWIEFVSNIADDTHQNESLRDWAKKLLAAAPKPESE